MHDPHVVAWTIRRPWPRREKAPLTRHTGRWDIRGSHWTLAGRLHLYWPTMVTIWHAEPGGHDSGEVCKHHRHDPVKGWVFYRMWRFHVHHWKIQVIPLQELRRRLLTRCEWCGGRSRKRDAVNVSHQWDGPKAPWWKGEPGLFHMDCSSVKRAHVQCLCDEPGPLTHGDHGTCAYCGKFRVWQNAVERLLPPRMSRVMLASLPEGSRIPAAMRPELERLCAAERAELGVNVSDG